MSSTLKELAIALSKKQEHYVDYLTNESPILDNMRFEASTHGLWNAYEEVSKIDGAGFVDINQPLPEMEVDSSLKKIDLSILGGEIFVPEDKAAVIGVSEYFSKKIPILLKHAGETAEKKIIYDNFIPYAVGNGKAVSAGQTYIVPKTEPAKPSSSSSGGYSHSHSYVYTDNGDGTHTGRCYANDSTLAPEAHTIVGGKCTVCGAEQTGAVVASVKKSDGTYAYYSTLAEAINAAADGATVTLVKNAEEDITVSGGKALAIDLNGMKLTNKSGDTIVVEIGATLTVTGSGTVDNVTHGKAAIYNNGTVILNGGSYTRSAEASTSIENANGNSYYNILNHGTMTIEENVSVKSSGSFSSLIANGYYSFSDPNPRSGHVSGTNQETPSLTINGGTFSGGINTIKNDDNATLTVNNGSFSNMTQAAIQNNHVATINGGTFDANTYHAIENRHFDGDHNTGSVTVTNGVFTGGLYTTEGAAWNITGGTYSSDPSEYVAEGYIARTNNDGKYVVSMVGTEENP